MCVCTSLFLRSRAGAHLGCCFPLCVCTSLLLRSPAGAHLGCGRVLAVVNSAAVAIGVRASFPSRAFVFSGFMPRSGIAVVKNVVLTSVIFWILHESC